MAQYLTVVGHSGVGRAANGDVAHALQFEHDLLLKAAEMKMDVFIMCGSVGSAVREQQYKTATGKTFADSIREVLEAGRNVSILIWDDTSHRFAPSLADLIESSDESPLGRGKLDVRLSGTHRLEGLVHFTIARTRDEKHWLVRVEQPHMAFTDIEWEGAVSVPAAIFFDTPDAMELSRPLLDSFDRLFNAVRDHDLNPSSIASAS